MFDLFVKTTGSREPQVIHPQKLQTMKKKSTKKQDAVLVQEVAEQAVAQIKEAVQQAAAEPKKRKMVEFKVLASIMEFATEKAQILSFLTEAGVEVKFWLSKSLSHFVADGDEPEKMICRVPAWLYYKAGLNNYFPITRWSQAVI